MHTTPLMEAELDDLLAQPSPGLVEDFAAGSGDLLVLGAGGKMGPSLCRLARTTLDAAGRTGDKVIAVSRWRDPALTQSMRDHGVEPLSTELEIDADFTSLPDAADVIYMVGAKFGSADQPGSAWVTNTVLPALLARRYAGSRMSALSTGNVYPFTAPESGGCVEGDPVGPLGDYAMSCLGRERVIQDACEHGLRATIVRLNYAVEPRYGVLCDIAGHLLDGDPIDLSTGYVNVIWQRYANEVVLRSLALASSPAAILNLTGTEVLPVRELATGLATRLGVDVTFDGEESPTALLSNASRCRELFGPSEIGIGQLLDMQAQWLLAGGRTLGKPTKFERRDGRF